MSSKDELHFELHVFVKLQLFYNTGRMWEPVLFESPNLSWAWIDCEFLKKVWIFNKHDLYFSYKFDLFKAYS